MVRTLVNLAFAISLTAPSFALAQDTEEPAPTAAPGEDTSEPEEPEETETEEPAPTPTPTPAPAAPEEAPDAVEEPAEDPAPAPSIGADEPSIQERRMVAYVASGAALVAVGVGATMGFLAQQQFDCLSDVVACNATLDDPIEGTELLDARAEVEHKALVADMMYLVAGAATVVAVTGYIRGYFLTGEESDQQAAGLEVAAPRLVHAGAEGGER